MRKKKERDIFGHSCRFGQWRLTIALCWGMAIRSRRRVEWIKNCHFRIGECRGGTGPPLAVSLKRVFAFKNVCFVVDEKGSVALNQRKKTLRACLL